MSQKTIQCQLFADEPARQYLLAVNERSRSVCLQNRNTPLINELLRLIALHPDFLTWRSKGKLPTAEYQTTATLASGDSDRLCHFDRSVAVATTSDRS